MKKMRDTNKLQTDISKTKELVFRRPSAHHFTAPQTLPFVEQLTITKLLGIYISATFSAVANYLRRVKAYALHIIFTAIALSVVTFALPSFAMFRKAFHVYFK